MITTTMLSHSETQLANLAARLLGLAVQTAEVGSDPSATADAAELHDREKLYPRLAISAPHGGGAVRLELTLNDSGTDQPRISLLTLEAIAEEPACRH